MRDWFRYREGVDPDQRVEAATREGRGTRRAEENDRRELGRAEEVEEVESRRAAATEEEEEDWRATVGGVARDRRARAEADRRE